MIRAVLDTNVFVSAFLISGRLNRLVELILKGAFHWVISQEILEEYMRVAFRPLYRLSKEEAETLFYQVKEHSVWIHTHSHFDVIRQDPSDNKFLACAVDGDADRIVTGDQHLLRLKTFRGVRIESPGEFLQALKA